MISAKEALQRLRVGNGRFVTGLASRVEAQVGHTRRNEVAEHQEPCAVVLGCSDSRVPAEIIFDQGLGDLFVVRVAGNIVAPSLVSSVEFAVTQFGTRLVVVLGHSQCGAILAAIDELQKPVEARSPIFVPIVDRIRPSLAPLLESALGGLPSALTERAVRANVLASANHLRHESATLKGLIQRDGLRVVGAEYALHTGVVDFFDGVSEVG